MNYKVYGSPKSGAHPKEAIEMATFFNALRLQYPDLHKVALHIRNEGKRSGRQMQWQKSQGGFVKGASDIIIPGNPAFVCELKSCSKSSKVSEYQEEYLNSCAKLGCFAVLAYGWEAAWEAVQEWQKAL
jgi:hypothetical protein